MWLGIDVGTGGSRALLVEENGAVRAGYTAPHEDIHMAHPQWAEQRPGNWWDAVVEAIRGVLAKAGVTGAQVKGIGLSGQMHGLVILDSAHRVIRPSLIWCDQRSQPQVDFVNAKVGREKVLEYTANPVLTGFTLPKLLWVRDKAGDQLPACAIGQPIGQRRSRRLFGSCQSGAYEDRVGVQQRRPALVQRRQPKRRPKLLEGRSIAERVGALLVGDAKLGGDVAGDRRVGQETLVCHEDCVVVARVNGIFVSRVEIGVDRADRDGRRRRANVQSSLSHLVGRLPDRPLRRDPDGPAYPGRSALGRNSRLRDQDERHKK
jgi:hypothetical protein